MIIHLKNKNTLLVDDFQFRCSIGKNGITNKKIEGDLSTPKGIFKLEYLLYRSDRINLPRTKLKTKKISKNTIWCNDSKSNNYNLQMRKAGGYSFEKLYRKDYKYNFIIVLDYNRKLIKKNKGSAIFIHLTKNYDSTAGCIALIKKDLQILLKIIKKNTYIKVH